MNFCDFYRSVNIPVLVYRDNETRTVAYLNNNAESMLLPDEDNSTCGRVNPDMPVSGLLKLPDGEYKSFQQLLHDHGEVKEFCTSIKSKSGDDLPVMLSANRSKLEGQSYIHVIINPLQSGGIIQYNAQELSNLVFKAKSTDEAIDNVLAFAGRTIGVSRCYIFESVSETLTSNTYEWCSEGVKPMINDLQQLPKEIYSYNKMMVRGLTVTDDIRQLPPNDRAVLGPQGIKALAIVPIYYQNAPLGYVGFDDCENYRKWTYADVQFLQSLPDVFASLIVRRNNERQLHYGLKTLRTVLDNFDNLIFVTNIHTNKLLFANTAFARSVDSTPEKLVGQFTATVLHSWAPNANDLDPLSQLIGADGLQKKEFNIREFYNHNTEKWYLFHDTIIKWTDGSDALLESATEITARKKYEEQLKHDASTDSMTGLYLRERGRQIIQQILDKPVESTDKDCLVFIDLDDLKHTNDKYGHAAGDRKIMKSIELILSNIRRSDTLCRWGGDEFVLIMRADHEQAERVMKKIQEQVSAYNQLDFESFVIGFSYGIVEIAPASGYTVDGLIAEADNRMYINKTASSGRHPRG